MDMAAIVVRSPVVPVLTIERAVDAVPLARALVKGGLAVLEITLRTDAALDALKAVAAELPQALVGAGTVLEPRQFDAVRRAGAAFAVSPGCTPALVRGAQTAGLPFLPGIQTVSEAMALAEQGFGLMKFFPAEGAGGLAWLKAAASPLAGLRFCPTGGIAAETAQACLSLGNVACVGGSWMAPRNAIVAGDWAAIERIAAAASQLERLPLQQ